MKSMTHVIVKDKGYNALLVEMKKSNKSLAVGILNKDADYTYDGGMTLYDIAVANEFGTISTLGNQHIPPRPFLSGTMDSHQREYIEWSRKVAAAIIDKKETVQTGLSKFGERIVADIQQTIIAHIPPPNAPSTIKRKRGSSTPLIDTGHLIHAIHYEVREGI